MKILEDIKKGILNEDWNIVLNAYNKISGENLSLPKKIFSPNTANKKELYEYVKTKRDLDKITAYKLVELKELAEFFWTIDNNSMHDEPTQETLSEETLSEEIHDDVVDDNPFFITSEQNLLPIDKKNINNGLKDSSKKDFLATGTNSDFKRQAPREPFKLVDAECMLCSKVSPVHASKVYSGGKATCDECASKSRG